MEIHPKHEAYLCKSHGNSVATLVELLDTLEPPAMRDNMIFVVAMDILQPRMRRPESVHDTINDLMEEHVSYNRFKERIDEMKNLISEDLFVAGIVSQILGFICGLAFPDVEKMKLFHQSNIKRLSAMAVEKDSKKAQLQQLIEMSEGKLRTMASDIKDHLAFYNQFCDKVLDGLLDEDARNFENTRKSMGGNVEDLSEDPFPGAPRE